MNGKRKGKSTDTFLKGLFAVGIGTFINLIIGFLTTPIITRIIDPYELGQYSMFSLYSGLAAAFLYIGMDQSLVRFYFKSIDISFKRRLFFESLFLPIVATTAFSIITIICIKLDLFDFGFDSVCLINLFVFVYLSVFFRFSLLLVRLNYNNKLYSLLQVLQKIIYVSIVVVFVKILFLNALHSLVFASVTAVFICLVISLISERKYLPRIKDGLDFSEMKSMFKYGFPFVFSVGIATLFQSLDKMALNYYRSYDEVGIYTSAMMFIALFSVIQTTFNTVWAPKAIEHYYEKPEDKTFYKSAFNLISFLMFFLGISLVLFKDLAALFLGPKYREAGYIMPFLIFEPIMYTISETTVNGINFKKKSYLHIVIAAGACIVNFIGNTILVPVLGCKGAAIATGLSYISFFVLRTFFGEKLYRVGFEKWKIMIVTLITIGFVTYNTFVEFNFITVLFAILCYLIICVLYKESIKMGLKIIALNLYPRLKNKKEEKDV